MNFPNIAGKNEEIKIFKLTSARLKEYSSLPKTFFIKVEFIGGKPAKEAPPKIKMKIATNKGTFIFDVNDRIP